MRTLTLLATILVLIAGCGQDPDKPVYDTRLNPENYPASACLVLDLIENGRLLNFDSIVTQFGELYVTHPELLDDQQWQQIIERLGVKFRHRADQLAEAGVAEYGDAAKHYTLAAFARPNDSRVQALRAKFGTWEQAIRDSIVPPRLDPSSTPLGIAEQLRILRYFLLDDSIHQQFANEFLAPRILNKHAAESALKAVGPQEISWIDKCFLTTLGFKYKGKEKIVASFTEPAIDLVAAQVTPQPHGWYAAELYFVPRESLLTDYTIALRIGASSGSPDPVAAFKELTFDFHPTVPTTQWKPGTINAAYRRFLLNGPISRIAVGIYERSADSSHFIPLRDTGEPLMTLPTSPVAGQ